MTHVECRSGEESLPNCRRAAMAGLASHHDEAVIEAAVCIATGQADLTPDIAQARDWIDVASAIMQRVSGNHPVLESWRLAALARVYQKEGRPDLALETAEKRRALTEKTLGTASLDYVRALNDIGIALNDNRRFEEASSYYRRAAQLALKVGGPNNDMAGLCFANAAEALNGFGRYAEAEDVVERALGIYRRVGTSAFLKGYALTMLGQSLLGQDRIRDAAASLEEALDLLKDGPTIYTPTVRFALARTLWTSPGSRPRALALAREAKAGYERFGKLAPDLPKVDAWLREHERRHARTH
jgi:tetratricopeptide (TPR) repeat protein